MPAAPGAELAENSDKYPVVLFAPGAGLLPVDFISILTNLTREGYVVFAVASPGTSGPILYSDGGAVTSQKINEQAYSDVVADLKFVHGNISPALSKDTSFLKDRVDLGCIGVLGHSVGGAAAFMASVNNPSVCAAINLDGDFPSPPVGSPTQPLLYITSDPQAFGTWPSTGLERSEQRRRDYWRRFSVQSTFANHVRMSGFLHMNFLDAAGLPENMIPDSNRKGRLGTVNGGQGLATTSTLVIGFLNQELRRKQQAWEKALVLSGGATSILN